MIYYRYDNKPVDVVLREGFTGTRHTDATIVPFGGNSVFSSRSKVGAVNFLKEIYNHPGYFSPGMLKGYQTSSVFNLYQIQHTGNSLDLYDFLKLYKNSLYPDKILRFFTLEWVLRPHIRREFPMINERILTQQALRLLEATPQYQDIIKDYFHECVAYTKEVILEGPIPPDKITLLGKVDLNTARFLTTDFI